MFNSCCGRKKYFKYVVKGNRPEGSRKLRLPDFMTTAPAAFTPRVDLRAMVWSEGNMSLKNAVTTPGIDPGTVRLVAQRLNHYATPGP